MNIRSKASKPPKRRVLDEIDREIIHQLQLDPQTSNKTIAQALGIQEATTAKRIADLIADGCMKITIQRNIKTFGYSTVGYVDLYVTSGNTQNVIDAVAEFDEVFSVHLFVGQPQIQIIVLAQDTLSFFHFVRTRVGKIRGVAKLNVAQSLRMVKYDTREAVL